ncbi:MAG TPA: hypothetical protein VGZ90_11830 [Puia sp.]|jgi:hypothetical protein|nr:hypothetical protein [Puia sp.]
MENFTTFLEFENGVLLINDSKIFPIISTIKSIIEPIIFERRLSGKIRIERFNNEISIGYDDVRPFAYVPELMAAIRRSSSAENFG